MEKKLRYKIILTALILIVITEIICFSFKIDFTQSNIMYWIIFLCLVIIIAASLKRQSIEKFAKSIGATKSKSKKIPHIFEGLTGADIYEYYYKNTSLGKFELYCFDGFFDTKFNQSIISKSSKGEFSINSIIVFEISFKTNVNKNILLISKNVWNKEIGLSKSERIKLESNEFNQKYSLYAQNSKDAYSFFNPIVIDSLNKCSNPIGMTITREFIAIYLYYTEKLHINNLENIYACFKEIINAHTNEKVDL